MLRPFGPFGGMPAGIAPDHPNFTGSNPTFDPVNGPWDVDNDGDGVAESVWVDIGLPVQTAPDGRRYKPLVAFHCVDLDSRLNVNAHGNWGANATYDTATPFRHAADRDLRQNQQLSVQFHRHFGGCVAHSPAARHGRWPGRSQPASNLCRSYLGYQNFLLGTTGPNNVVYEGRYGEYAAADHGTAQAAANAGAYGPDDILRS